MSKKHLLLVITGILILLNCGLLLFLVFGRPAPPPHPRVLPAFQQARSPEGPRQIICQRLRFDVEQREAYDRLIQHHRHDIRDLETSIHKMRRQLYASLKTPRASQSDSLIRAISDKLAAIEHVHFNHFRDIRDLCKTPEQQEAFRRLSEDLAALFSPGHP